MSHEAPMVIEMTNVTVPSRRNIDIGVIEKVNWTLQAGAFWVVGGLQGTGKSDLMFMLAGLTKPLAGTYRLFGCDMGRGFADDFLPNRLRVGMVFDDARLLNHLTIAENVSLPVRYHQNAALEDAQEWSRALLQATEIAEFALDSPSAVGRNWRRRAALARALALRPDILFLENPLRGLDWRHNTWWIDFIRQLWRGHGLMGGKAMTVITSDDELRPWRGIATHYAMLRQRRLVTLGSEAPEDEQAFLRAHSGEGI